MGTHMAKVARVHVRKSTINCFIDVLLFEALLRRVGKVCFCYWLLCC